MVLGFRWGVGAQFFHGGPRHPHDLNAWTIGGSAQGVGAPLTDPPLHTASPFFPHNPAQQPAPPLSSPTQLVSPVRVWGLQLSYHGTPCQMSQNSSLSNFPPPPSPPSPPPPPPPSLTPPKTLKRVGGRVAVGAQFFPGAPRINASAPPLAKPLQTYVATLRQPLQTPPPIPTTRPQTPEPWFRCRV